LPINELRAIETFAKAVELGSIRRAAMAQGVSPQAASQALAQLEQHLGVRLLHRTTRSLALTEEGQRLLESTQLRAVEGGDAQRAGGVQASPSALNFGRLTLMGNLHAPTSPSRRRQPLALNADGAHGRVEKGTMRWINSHPVVAPNAPAARKVATALNGLLHSRADDAVALATKRKHGACDSTPFLDPLRTYKALNRTAQANQSFRVQALRDLWDSSLSTACRSTSNRLSGIAF
jgi:hypothetical protein